MAKKTDIKTLGAQLEEAKNAHVKKESGDGVASSSQATTVDVKPSLPKPHVWATKSWAKVLTDAPPAPVEVDSVGEEDEEDESDSEDESDNENDQEKDEAEEGSAGASGVTVDADKAVDHFTAAATESLEALQLDDSLENADASASFVTGFDEDCGCAHAAEEAHHHVHASEATAVAPLPVKAAVPVAESSTKEPWHSRMMRPSGLSSGNNPLAHAAESNKMRLEDDGKGWVNHTNLLQNKGRNGYSVNAHTAKKPKAPKVVTDADSETVTEENSIAASATTTAPSVAVKKNKKKKRPTKVACLTTDFSMQNVMLQMTLRVMSVDGLMIKSAKQWVLRCMGCCEVHYDMDRLFCRKCGGHHLSRVSASVDSGGELRLHLKKNYHVDLRGSQYSLPAPGKQGRYQGELLLREDQLLAGIWKQKVVKIRKDIKSAFGEDVTSDVGMHINKGQAIKIGMGKQNVNSAKGRERRGKSKSHTVK